MRGGRGHRKFYISETGRIFNEYKSKLVPVDYTPEEIDAGFDNFSRAFAFFLPIRTLERATPFTRHQILKWALREFHAELIFLNHESAMQRKLKFK